jgi:hypothetical protein
MNEVIESGPFAGFEVVHRYTRAQAIDDGVLVDVTTQAKGCGFRIPVAMTSALFNDCWKWAEAVAQGDEEPSGERFVELGAAFRMRNDPGVQADRHGSAAADVELFRGLPRTGVRPHRPRRYERASRNAHVPRRRMNPPYI